MLKHPKLVHNCSHPFISHSPFLNPPLPEGTAWPLPQMFAIWAHLQPFLTGGGRGREQSAPSAGSKPTASQGGEYPGASVWALPPYRGPRMDRGGQQAKTEATAQPPNPAHLRPTLLKAWGLSPSNFRFRNCNWATTSARRALLCFRWCRQSGEQTSRVPGLGALTFQRDLLLGGERGSLNDRPSSWWTTESSIFLKALTCPQLNF